MSYFVDRYTIYKAHEKEVLHKLREFLAGKFWEFAEEQGIDDELSWEELRNYIQPVSESLRNEMYYLFVAPDGSKEGWDVSNLMNDVIEAAEKYIDEWNYRDERKWGEQIKYFYVYDDDYREGYSVARKDILND